MLKQRNDKVYDLACLGQTEKFAKLSPDFTTVWNYRREILEHLFKEQEGQFSTLQGKLEVIKNELLMLVKQVMSSPKSYSIWEHRVWTITLGLTLEREYLAAMKAKKLAEKAEEEKKQSEAASAATEENGNDGDEAAELMNMPGQEVREEGDEMWKSAILDNELKLCSKMLAMDERNFHCWNYRNQIANLYCKEIELRVLDAQK